MEKTHQVGPRLQKKEGSNRHPGKIVEASNAAEPNQLANNGEITRCKGCISLISRSKGRDGTSAQLLSGREPKRKERGGARVENNDGSYVLYYTPYL